MMKKAIITGVIILVCSLIYGQCESGSKIKFDNYGLISETYVNGGDFNVTVVIDTILFVGCEAGFLIYDVSDIDEYVLVSYYRCYPVQLLCIINDTAYLGTKINPPDLTGKVEILDISDLSDPVYIASHEISDLATGLVTALQVKGDYVYVGYGFSLYIIDFSDMNNPVEYMHATGYNKDIIVDDSLLFTMVGSGLDTYKIQNDTNLIFVSTINCSGSNAYANLQKNGDLIYYVRSSLQIIDVSDIYNPAFVSETIFENNFGSDLYIDQSTAYITGYAGILGMFSIVDLTTPEDPVILMDTNEYIGSCISGFQNKIYINSSGVITLDIEEPGNVELLNHTTSTKAKKCRLFDNMVYLANGFSGFQIIDVYDLFNPVISSATMTKWMTIDVLKDSDILYVAVADSGIQIYNIEDPAQPVWLSDFTMDVSGIGFLHLVKYEDYLYTGGAWPIKEIIDVSDPENPVLAGQIPVNDLCIDLKLMEQHLFVAGNWGGFQIFSLADPVNPVEVGYYPLQLALQIAVSISKAFIVGIESILIFDITDYSSPSLITSYNSGPVEHMLAIGDSLYYSDSYSNIYILDVSDPSNPNKVDSIVNARALSFDFIPDGLIMNDEYFFTIYGDTTAIISGTPDGTNEKKLLKQNIPNPCSLSTRIPFVLDKSSHVTIEIFNNSGILVNKIKYGKLDIGEHQVLVNTESLSP